MPHIRIFKYIIIYHFPDSAPTDVVKHTCTDTAGVLVTFSHLFIAAALKPLYS